MGVPPAPVAEAPGAAPGAAVAPVAGAGAGRRRAAGGGAGGGGGGDGPGGGNGGGGGGGRGGGRGGRGRGAARGGGRRGARGADRGAAGGRGGAAGGGGGEGPPPDDGHGDDDDDDDDFYSEDEDAALDEAINARWAQLRMLLTDAHKAVLLNPDGLSLINPAEGIVGAEGFRLMQCVEDLRALATELLRIKAEAKALRARATADSQPSESSSFIKKVERKIASMAAQLKVQNSRSNDMMGGIGTFADPNQKRKYQDLALREEESREQVEMLDEHTSPDLAKALRSGHIKLKAEMKLLGFATRHGDEAQALYAYRQSTINEDPETLKVFQETSEARNKMAKWRKSAGTTVFGEGAYPASSSAGQSPFGNVGGTPFSQQHVPPGGNPGSVTPGGRPGGVGGRAKTAASRTPAGWDPSLAEKLDIMAGFSPAALYDVRARKYLNFNKTWMGLNPASFDNLTSPITSAACDWFPTGIPGGFKSGMICMCCGRRGHRGFECPITRALYASGHIDMFARPLKPP